MFVNKTEKHSNSINTEITIMIHRNWWNRYICVKNDCIENINKMILHHATEYVFMKLSTCLVPTFRWGFLIE